MHKPTGLLRLRLAFGYSMAGFRAAFVHEEAFRQELLVIIVLLPLAFVLDVSASERVILLAALAIVIIVELLNSAVEAVVDRIGPEHHELAGRAKDLGSAAVLVAVLLATYAWLDIGLGALLN